MIDTTVRTYHGISACFRKGYLISSGYYHDVAGYEDCVPLLIALYENQFAWERFPWEDEYDSTHQTSDESSLVDEVMELLDCRMGDFFDELSDKWDFEPEIPKGHMLYFYKPSRGRGKEIFFFSRYGNDLDCFKRVGSWFKGMIGALWVRRVNIRV